MSFSSGQTLTAAGLDAALMAVTPPNAPLLSGTGTTFGSVAIGANLTLSIAGTLSATGVITNAGLGLADSAGTVSLGTIAAGSLMGNAGSVAAVPGAVAVGANLTLSVAGTLSATGVITAAASGLTANAGTVSLGTLASAGLLGGELGAAPGVITLGTNLSFAGSTLNAAGSSGGFSAAGAGLTSSGSTVSLGPLNPYEFVISGGTLNAIGTTPNIVQSQTFQSASALSTTGTITLGANTVVGNTLVLIFAGMGTSGGNGQTAFTGPAGSSLAYQDMGGTTPIFTNGAYAMEVFTLPITAAGSVYAVGATNHNSGGYWTALALEVQGPAVVGATAVTPTITSNTISATLTASPSALNFLVSEVITKVTLSAQSAGLSSMLAEPAVSANTGSTNTFLVAPNALGIQQSITYTSAPGSAYWGMVSIGSGPGLPIAGTSGIYAGANNSIQNSGSYNVIAGGSGNLVQGDHNFIGGGSGNVAAGVAGAVFGQGNTISAAYSQNGVFVAGVSNYSNGALEGGGALIGNANTAANSNVGPNWALGYGNYISAANQVSLIGVSNSITTNGNYSVLVGYNNSIIASGNTNVAAGQNNVFNGGQNSCIFGQGNTIGSGSAILGNNILGYSNVITSGSNVAIVGGISCSASGSLTTTGGYYGTDRGNRGGRVWGGSYNFGTTTPGHNQIEDYLLTVKSTGTTTVRVTTDGTGSASATNIGALGTKTVASFQAVLTMYDTTNNWVANYTYGFEGAPGIVQVGSSAATTSIGNSPTVFAQGSTVGSVPTLNAPTVSADTTYSGLNVSVLPPNGDTIYIECHLMQRVLGVF